jgi:hypothetical protein
MSAWRNPLMFGFRWAGNLPLMRADDEERKPLHEIWTDLLGRWLRPRHADEEEKPTTAASQSMRERLDEPHD